MKRTRLICLKEIGLISLFLLVLDISSVLSKKEPPKRTFTTAINPDCTFALNCESSTTVNLIHIRSDSKIDSLHFVWSFIGRPSVLMVRTSLSSDLHVDWSKYLSPDSDDDVAITFNGSLPFYSFGSSLLKLWVFNDTNETNRMDDHNIDLMHSYDTNGFLWERQPNPVMSSSEINLNFVARNYTLGNESFSLGSKGYFGIRIRMKNTDEYNDFLPYMLYSGNSSQVDISFNDVQLNFTNEFPYPKNPRIGLTYAFVQGNSDKDKSSMKIEKVVTLDDERSPGVFELYRLRTPVSISHEEAFFQWRPVCYTSDTRDIPDSIDTTVYNLSPANNSDLIEGLNDTILWSYYGDEIENFLIQSFNISFGVDKDGFYKKTKHISWSYVTGFGEPPTDRTSLVVMLVIMIGLGIPVIIILGSLIYVVSKRMKKPRDDLLLGN